MVCFQESNHSFSIHVILVVGWFHRLRFNEECARKTFASCVVTCHGEHLSQVFFFSLLVRVKQAHIALTSSPEDIVCTSQFNGGIDGIFDFANTCDLEDVREVIQRQIDFLHETDVDFLLVKELENGEEDLRDDVYLVESDAVELDDILIPELIMDMEMSVVCDEDCKGLCFKCGKDLNQGPCGCVTKEVDPRLAVLQKFLDSKE